MEGVAVGPPAVLDGFVFGVIFYAMRLGEDLRVCGPMTRRALLNLSEFQAAWISWKPHVYHKINIIPDSIVDPAPATKKKAIAAFSGGLCDELAESQRTIELEMAGLKNELVAAKARLASACSSRSWRFTAPLRWCDHIQRNVVRQLRKRLGADD